MTNEIEATTGINTSKKCSSKSTPQLVLRFLSDQPSVPMRFGKHFDSMNANVFPPKDELHCFLERGHEADDQGLYPIHKACIEYPQNAKLIGMIIRSLPQSVEFKVKGTKQLSRNNSATQLNTETTHKRTLSLDSESSLDSIGTKSLKFINGMYPIHIAVANSASLEVVKLLVRSNPNVLSLTDGNGMVPLSLALRCHDRSSNMEYFTKLVNFLIASNPHAATVADVRSNTPLHYACMTYIHAGGVVQRRRISSTSTETLTSMPHGRISPIESQKSISKSITSSIVPIQILRLLLEANPDAINQPNFNGDTPLALAERSENIDDESITLLQTTAYRDEEVEEAPDNLF
jgi:ankyrin repeat protein